MTLAPQFWARVRGMTSSATPTAAYGHCSTPAHIWEGDQAQRVTGHELRLQASPKLHKRPLCGSIHGEVVVLPYTECCAAHPGHIARACVTGSALVSTDQSQCEARPSQLLPFAVQPVRDASMPNDSTNMLYRTMVVLFGEHF